MDRYSIAWIGGLQDGAAYTVSCAALRSLASPASGLELFALASPPSAASAAVEVVITIITIITTSIIITTTIIIIIIIIINFEVGTPPPAPELAAVQLDRQVYIYIYICIIYMFIYLSIYLSISLSLSIYLSIYLSISLRRARPWRCSTWPWWPTRPPPTPTGARWPCIRIVAYIMCILYMICMCIYIYIYIYMYIYIYVYMYTHMPIRRIAL